MIHYIYKITCTISNRFYYGMHSTKNLDDEYFGGGKILKRSIEKYGKDSHIREILEYLSDRESLKIREREIVDEDLLKDPLCMNLKIGGEGGGQKGVKRSQSTKDKISAGNKGKKRSPQCIEKMRINSTGRKFSQDVCEKKRISMTGKIQSPESNAKRSASMTGKKQKPEQGIKSGNTRRGKPSKNKGRKNGPPSPETIDKIIKSKTGKSHPQRKVVCPVCKMEGSASNMKRWHFEKCVPRKRIIRHKEN